MEEPFRILVAIMLLMHGVSHASRTYHNTVGEAEA